MNTEEIIEMIITNEAEVDLGIDDIQITPEGMTEVVVDQVPTIRVEKEAEQIQQMYNMDEEQTALKLLVTDTYDSLNIINSIDETAMDHLNL